MEFNLEYYKENAEENYITTPISVLRYISELESHIENSCAPEMLEMLNRCSLFIEYSNTHKTFKIQEFKNEIEKLIQKATTI